MTDLGSFSVQPYNAHLGLFPVVADGCIYVTAYFNTHEEAEQYVAWRNALRVPGGGLVNNQGKE